jgi:hypothetical protein
MDIDEAGREHLSVCLNDFLPVKRESCPIAQTTPASTATSAV